MIQKFLADFTDCEKYVKTKGVLVLVVFLAYWLLVGMVEAW